MNGATKQQCRSDMAVEFAKSVSGSKSDADTLSVTEVKVDAALAAKLGRPEGRYVTVESKYALCGDRSNYMPLIESIAGAIRSMCVGSKTFLAVGVGNPLLTADALGSRAVTLLKVNRGSRAVGSKELSAFAPIVSGITGIESFDIVAGVCSIVKPDCVIIIDSLASAAVSRIGTAFQICDSGLTPGSGVGGKNRALNAENLKVRRTVSVGVPLVVHAETIIRDALGGKAENINPQVADLVVTPKDIDMVMSECAHIIAESINAALSL